MRVRAVVCNFNGGDEVLACLASLGEADEVVVVDNGSTDGSDRAVERVPGVRLIRSPRNLGYPGLNQAMTSLDGVDAVLVVNPDAVVQAGCLDALVSALDDPAVDAACPRIVLDGAYRSVTLRVDGPRPTLDLLAVEDAGRWHLTGPRVRRRWRRGVQWSVGDGSVLRTTSSHVRLQVQAHAPTTLTLGGATSAVGRTPVWVRVVVDGPAVEVVQNAGSVIGLHGVGGNRGYHRPDGPAFDVACDVPAWCGAGVLLRASYLQRHGLLDPRWFLYYEDTDLAWRGLLHGARYRYVPGARVTHAHSTTIGHGSGLYDVQHHRNRLLTVTKNAPAPAVLAAWGDSVRLLGTQLRGDVVARVRDRRLPEPVLTWRRVRGLASAARLTPQVWRDRAAVRTGAVADPPVLGRWVDPVEGV